MANKLIAAIKTIKPKAKINWFGKLPPAVQKDLLEVREKYRAGEFICSLRDMHDALCKQLPQLGSIDVFRRWMNGK